MHGWMEGAWGHMGGMGLWWILILVGLVALVIWAVRSAGGAGERSSSGGGSAEEILRERFARGEIDEEEYRKLRDELRRG